MDSGFKAIFKKKMTAERKRETWYYKKLGSEDEARRSRQTKNEDAKRRKIGRKQTCVARGLINCRKLRNQTQVEFAKYLGISRRALVNYENGTRAVGSDVLEKILTDEHIELHDVFDLQPEPTPIESRLEIADLTIDLLLACLAEFPNADPARMLTLVKHHVSRWPKSRRTSSKNIEKAAIELMDILANEMVLRESD